MGRTILKPQVTSVSARGPQRTTPSRLPTDLALNVGPVAGEQPTSTGAATTHNIAVRVQTSRFMSFIFNLWCLVQPTGGGRNARRLSGALPLVAQPDAVRMPRAARPNTTLELQVFGQSCGESQGDRTVTLVGACADADCNRLAKIHFRNHRQCRRGSYARISGSRDGGHGALDGIELGHIHRIGWIDPRRDIGDPSLVARCTDRYRVGLAGDRACAERDRVRRGGSCIGTQCHAVPGTSQCIRTDHRSTVLRCVGPISESNAVRTGCRRIDARCHRIEAGRTVVVVVALRRTVVVHAVVVRARSRYDRRQRSDVAVRRAQAR
ncbi:hypothetical protein SAMN05421548_13935 [Paraburkholderia lycopersici]|uniref:Uncharacterized protein n=1 Tax=Paraburkholderia lycopersici TaxID=416944 RepID=A0A1G7BGG0_9BURK|nr:hypothetical protein SAMN05421548_13935 [Paraburkholderia lycopersici]